MSVRVLMGQSRMAVATILSGSVTEKFAVVVLASSEEAVVVAGIYMHAAQGCCLQKVAVCYKQSRPAASK